MQVAIETTEGLERRLTIDVPAEQIDIKVEKRIQEASKTIRINGFRKGKVPLKVIKQHYGPGIRQEILGDVINHSFEEAIAKESVKPAGQPNIEIKQFEEGKPLQYTATFEVYPTIELSSLEGFQVTRQTAEVTDADVEEMLETLRDQRATFNKVERPAQMDDQVVIDFKGRKDGELFDGGSAEGHTLVLGSKNMIPGFEEGIVGMAIGEVKTIALTFPEDYHSEDLKGAETEFDITLHSVSEKVRPEIDEAFIAQFGIKGGDVESFKKDGRDNMERELALAARSKVKKQVMDKLLEDHNIDIPSALIANEVQALREQMIQQFGGAANNKNLDFKSLLPDDMFSEEAKRRVSLGLIITEVVKTNEMKPDAQKVQALIEEVAASYPNPEMIHNYYKQNPQLMASAESSALEDQVVELILAKADITDVTTNYKEIVKKDA